MLEILLLWHILCSDTGVPTREGEGQLSVFDSPPPPLVSLSIAQVNQYLDDLALSHVKKDKPGVKRAIQLMLRNTSAQEQKWLIRIIMKVILSH